ncbi:MAG TPA: hypothetical protein VHX13_00575 [Acidobacteriaceae bacterium]|jgi:hypothetical protein|nr:hypothetical protein [Acidobacteriaceae bacterium]
MADPFEHRARQLIDAMKLLEDDLSNYASAVALLAVHSAIAWNDAVQIRLTGKRAKYRNHGESAKHSRRICGSRGIDVKGINHFEALLGSKNAVAYDETLILEPAADKARTHALRFETWALRILGGQ